VGARPAPRVEVGLAATVSAPPPARSRTGVGSVMDRLKPFDSDVRIKLCRCERSVTKQLLNATQVSSSFEKMSGGRVAQAVRAEIRSPGNRRHRLVHDLDRKSTRLNSSHVKISYAVF